MISQIAFTNQMNRLAESFPAVTNRGRMPRYFRAVQYLPENAVVEIIDGFLDRAKQTPTPQDFVDAAAAWRRANTDSSQITVSIQKIECLDCYETGYLHCQLNQQEPMTFVFCHCEFGGQRQGEVATHIPRWNQDTFARAYGFIKHQFPMRSFMPPETAEGDLHLRISDRRAWWLKTKSEVLKYWEGKVNR